MVQKWWIWTSLEQEKLRTFKRKIKMNIRIKESCRLWIPKTDHETANIPNQLVWSYKINRRQERNKEDHNVKIRFRQKKKETERQVGESGAGRLKEIEATSLKWKDTKLEKVEENNFEDNLNVDRNAENMADG